jgi:hypothetical protein
MIYGHHEFGDFRELEYVLARLKIDALCELISQQRVTAAQAKEAYQRIESRFLSSNQEKADLFKMIYKSRIERLCQQHLKGSV